MTPTPTGRWRAGERVQLVVHREGDRPAGAPHPMPHPWVTRRPPRGSDSSYGAFCGPAFRSGARRRIGRRVTGSGGRLASPRYRRPADRNRERSPRNRNDLRRGSCRSCGHVFSGRTSPPGGSLWSGARRGTRRAPGPKVGVGVSLGRAARPPPPLVEPPSPSRSPRARDTMRSPRSQARRLVAAV